MGLTAWATSLSANGSVKMKHRQARDWSTRAIGAILLKHHSQDYFTESEYSAQRLVVPVLQLAEIASASIAEGVDRIVTLPVFSWDNMLAQVLWPAFVTR